MPISTGVAMVPIAPAVSTSLDVATAVGTELPPTASVRGARAIQNQRVVECCVSCALVTAAESARPKWRELSALFHYYLTRVERMGADRSANTRLQVNQAIRVLENSGICRREFHSPAMDLAGLCETPSPDARTDAKNQMMPPISVSLFEEVSRIERLKDGERVLEWKRQLLAQRPIVAVIELFEGYGQAMEMAPWPAVRKGGLHAVTILGYREGKGAFVAQDSRGPEWFLGGQWYMPYAFAQSEFVVESYAMRLT
jgi:hypothetical protein